MDSVTNDMSHAVGPRIKVIPVISYAFGRLVMGHTVIQSQK